MSKVLGQEIVEYFTVNDKSYNPVPDIDPSEFVCEIYDSERMPYTNGFSIDHIGSGNYTLRFIPNKIGSWYILLRHPNYFPWGKASEFEVCAYAFDDIGDMVKRILGLTFENYAIDQTQYDENNNLTNSRIRIYKNAIAVGTGVDVLAEYNMSATYDGDNKMISYSVEKV
jgi:hypothetical protein